MGAYELCTTLQLPVGVSDILRQSVCMVKLPQQKEKQERKRIGLLLAVTKLNVTLLLKHSETVIGWSFY